MDDIFCKIIKGEIPCHKIYEDEFVLAFLDIANDIYGHTLVVPKKHFNDIFDVSQETLNHIMFAIKKITLHYKEKGINDVNILNNSGANAEQSINHLHFHIIPRFHSDNFKIWREFDKQTKTLEEITRLLAF